MPRAFLKTKNRGGHHVYTCTRCGKPIEAGQDYYTWKFNRGGRYFQHAEHGYPKPSQLTNSKMGTVYDAVESFGGPFESIEDIKSALSSVADAARDVGQEYGDSADAIEQGFPSGNPTSEACRATSEELESYADNLESWEPDNEEFDPEFHDDEAEWLEAEGERANELVQDHPEYQG